MYLPGEAGRVVGDISLIASIALLLSTWPAASEFRLRDVTGIPSRSPRRICHVPARWWTGGDACSAREAVRRLHEKLVGNVSSAVVFALDDMQGGERELLRKTPGHAER